DDMSKHHVLYVGSRNTAAVQHGPHHSGAEFRRRNILQCTAKIAYRCPAGCHDDDIFHDRAPKVILLCAPNDACGYCSMITRTAWLCCWVDGLPPCSRTGPTAIMAD